MFNFVDDDGGQQWSYDPTSKMFFDAAGEPLGFMFDPEKSEFTTENGVVLKLQPANMQMIMMFQSNYKQEHEPEMPQRAIEYDEGKFILEGNDKDPWYQRQFDNFVENLGLAVMEFIVSLSVKNDPPPVEKWSPRVRDMMQAIGVDTVDASDPKNRSLVKYAWVATLFNSDVETEAFMVIVQGQSLPTERGMAKAAERFPGEGERNGRHPVSNAPVTSELSDDA